MFSLHFSSLTIIKSPYIKLHQKWSQLKVSINVCGGGNRGVASFAQSGSTNMSCISIYKRPCTADSNQTELCHTGAHMRPGNNSHWHTTSSWLFEQLRAESGASQWAGSPSVSSSVGWEKSAVPIICCFLGRRRAVRPRRAAPPFLGRARLHELQSCRSSPLSYCDPVCASLLFGCVSAIAVAHSIMFSACLLCLSRIFGGTSKEPLVISSKTSVCIKKKYPPLSIQRWERSGF